MAKSKLNIAGIGDVVIVRRRGLKNISLRVDHTGVVKLNLPWFVPKATGLLFLHKKRDWLTQQIEKRVVWQDNSKISGIMLKIIDSNKSRTSWEYDNSQLTINIPKSYKNTKKQEKIDKILTTFMKQQTEKLIVPKIYELASSADAKLSSVKVKKLRSRWGSCDHKGNIKLSLYLFTLPESLSNYVLCHELAHLNHLNHSAKFWQKVASYDPNYKDHRKQLRSHSPNV